MQIIDVDRDFLFFKLCSSSIRIGEIWIAIVVIRTAITMFMTGKLFEMSELDGYIGSLGKGYVIE